MHVREKFHEKMHIHELMLKIVQNVDHRCYVGFIEVSTRKTKRTVSTVLIAKNKHIVMKLISETIITMILI